MDRLEQIKNEVSMDFHLKETDWRELSGEIARRYATEMVRHNLERAANEAEVLYRGHSFGDYVVNKESITSLEIELV